MAEKKETVYIDGSNLIMGRLASKTAKLALNGKKVVIVNCDKIALTGPLGTVAKDYSKKAGKVRGRHKGPFWPRRPDNFVRKAIKRMLPYKKERGKTAFKNIELYIGVPKEYESQKLQVFEDVKARTSVRITTIGELSERLGSTGWK